MLFGNFISDRDKKKSFCNDVSSLDKHLMLLEQILRFDVVLIEKNV